MLLLRDVLGWSAKDTGSLLEASVASVNSALQRARATLRDHLPERRTDWAQPSGPSGEERELLRRYVDAHERTDVDALAALLLEDARLTMPPHATWYAGRKAILVASEKGFDLAFGQLRSVVTGANLQPAAAHYLRPPGESQYRPLASTCFGSRADESLRSARSSSPAVSGIRPSADALSIRAMSFLADLVLDGIQPIR